VKYRICRLALGPIRGDAIERAELYAKARKRAPAFRNKAPERGY
jgi:hypothetical protein